MFASKHNFPILFFSLVTIKSSHTKHQNIITPTTNHRSNKTQPCHVVSPLQMKPPSYRNSRRKPPSPAPLESPSHSPSPSQNHHRTSTPNSPLAFTRFYRGRQGYQPPSHHYATHKPFRATNCNGQSGGKHHRTKQGCYRSQGGFWWTRAGKYRAELRH